MTMALLPNKIKPKSLVETKVADLLKVRIKQFFGLSIFGCGILLFTLLISYSPNDPSFRSATDKTPENILGHFGSHVADPLHLALGIGSFLTALIFLVWGGRIFLGSDKRKIIPRIIFAPMALASVSTFLSAHPAGFLWNFSYGLGGAFGDEALTWLVELEFLEINDWLKVLTFLLLLTSISTSIYVLGVTKKEIMFFSKRFVSSLLQTLKFLIIIPLIFKRQSLHNKMNYKKPIVNPTESENIEYSHPCSLENQIQDRISEAIANRKGNLGEIQPQDENTVAFDTRLPALGGVTRNGQRVASINGFQNNESSLVSRTKIKKNIIKRNNKSKKAIDEEQPKLQFETIEKKYETPALSLLENPSNIVRLHLSDDALGENARMLENVLDDYGVRGEIVSVRPGPVVTLYELEPAAGLKASRVIGLSDDIARSMSALSARVSTIPGRSVIGIELPNSDREKVLLREILSSKSYGDSKFQLPLALGKDIGGEPIVANLARMPHLLIAGTTGSGKSVGINTMILSLLYRLTPEECRMIMIDPKMLELSVYDGIPHLLSPVVTDPKKAVVALKWAVAEMEERYRKMSKMGVRNVDGYNAKVVDAISKGESFSRTVQTGFDNTTGDPVFETEHFTPEKMPYIVIVVDEMADLMMVAGKEIEACIQRLAQMARAAGIHLIMATQRPSVDVITGTIKANFPTRISFQVTSKIDSRTILGEMGAEQLLGMGDMLYMANGGRITRIHGPFVSDEEVEEIVTFLKAQGEPEYVSGVLEGPDSEAEARMDVTMGLSNSDNESENALFDQAVAIVAQDRKCSTSYIQRKLSIGYNRAAKIVEAMEEQGVVSSANHVGKREILLPEH